MSDHLPCRLALKQPGGMHLFKASSVENLISDVTAWFREKPGANTEINIAMVSSEIKRQLNGRPGTARLEFRFVGPTGKA